jgi:hypothetical protein
VAKVRGLNDDDLEQLEHFVDVEVAAIREELRAFDLGDQDDLPPGPSGLSTWATDDEENGSCARD